MRVPMRIALALGVALLVGSGLAFATAALHTADVVAVQVTEAALGGTAAHLTREPAPRAKAPRPASGPGLFAAVRRGGCLMFRVLCWR